MFAAGSEVICVGLRQELPVLIHSVDHEILTAAAVRTPIAEYGTLQGYVETLFLTLITCHALLRASFNRPHA